VAVQQSRQPDLTLQIWDFAGQREYYVTHKVFLAPSALYLVVFDLRLQRQGVDTLHPWLSDIQVGRWGGCGGSRGVGGREDKKSWSSRYDIRDSLSLSEWS